MSKVNDCVQVNLRITTNSNQGGRKYMEDAYAIALQRLNPSEKESPISLAYFGIFDGHGGKEAAEFARQSLCQHILEQDDFWPNTSDESQNDQLILSAIRQGFLACHNDMWNHVEKWSKTSSGLPSTSGCTASVAFVRGNKLYVGHVGDSAIVLGEGDALYKPWLANRLTRDHKPEDPLELNRIRESGGNVLCKAGVHRVVWNRQKITTNSSHHYRHRHQHSVTTTTTTSTGAIVEYEQIPFLAVSRALGDLWSLNAHTNLYSVSPEPELTVIEIDPKKHRCIILASDGLWNMITPEAAVEIVRNCDVKTEEMILKSDDDDHRPFRNPSHELVQKALTLWRERMLRSDNITCVTVMLDPPGPPFSDCIVKKKKERLTYSISSSTNSVFSDDTVELDHPSPLTPTTVAITTPYRVKPVLERKEHILTPISNGPTPMRTPKRPASDDVSTLIVDTPRRKLIKTNQQKENGRTSPSTNGNFSESAISSSLPSSSLVQSSSSTSHNEEQEQEQEFFDLTEQRSKSSMLNSDNDEGDDRDNINDDDDDDLTRNVARCLHHNSEQPLDNHLMQMDQTSQNLLKEKSTRPSSHIRPFPFSKVSNDRSNEEDLEELPRLCRTRSVSTTISFNNDIQLKLNSSRRRKSYSNTDFINHSNNIQINQSNNSDKNLASNFEQKSTSSKIKSPLTNLVTSPSKQSLTNHFRRTLSRSNRGSPTSRRLIHSIVSSSSSQ
ncbi:unnamed protein product [Rotaria socialis]|uniref:PPM-type phosphatase domain-containing protein n=5 Tax=Rotaria socialis TaxID=392032 RepID=A0A818XA87_9BILA|nr:unnamed protein product [Rotaria socialis]CAF4202069.1 unnamed protein product [Rotaria socialis]